MFTQFSFKRFKSFYDSILPVSPLTILIGANASGKSNALEGIYFLSQLTRLKVTDIINGVRGQTQGIRGGSEKVFFGEEGFFEVSCQCVIESITYEYSMQVKAKPEIKIQSEKLVAKVDGNSKVFLSFNEEGYGQIDHMENFVRADSVTSLLPIYFSHNLNRREFNREMERIFPYNPVPEYMKNYVNSSDHELKANAENISAVIANLMEDREVMEILLDQLQDLPEQQITDIGVLRTIATDSDANDVMLVLKERVGERTVSFNARHLSDGTLRFLAIVVALLVEPEGTTLTLEEIDTGIHPARLQKLLSFMSKMARKKNMSIIATTHNPALLNALSRDDIPGVVVCYRDLEKGDSQLVRLMDLPSYPELMTQGRVGDLLARGLIEKAVHETEEDREQDFAKKLKWIEEELE